MSQNRKFFQNFLKNIHKTLIFTSNRCNIISKEILTLISYDDFDEIVEYSFDFGRVFGKGYVLEAIGLYNNSYEYLENVCEYKVGEYLVRFPKSWADEIKGNLKLSQLDYFAKSYGIIGSDEDPF